MEQSDRLMAKSRPTGPVLHDDSNVYVYNASSSTGNSTQDLGNIGDHICATTGLLLSCNKSERHAGHSTPQVNSKVSILQDLVAGSTPDLSRYQILRPIEQVDLVSVAWGAQSRQKSSTSAYKQDSTTSTTAISGQDLKARLLQYLIDMRENFVVTPELVDRISATPSTASIRGTHSASSQESTSSVEDLTSESEALIAPIWRRYGPSFAFITKHLTNRYQLGVPAQVITYDDLDPEEFSLPYSSLVFCIKSNNVMNMHNAVKTSTWSSTLGSNKVLSDAYLKKKSDEKIILLFSVAHSLKYGNKYLGMAEVTGPLEFSSNVGSISEKRAAQGFVPIRWIVAKDVPFAKFSDLQYREQPVIQVRHGNTIPGEVGRLVVQRLFEAAHWPTATLHPLSNYGTNLDEVSNTVVNRHRSSSQKNTRFHHDHKGVRGGHSRRYLSQSFDM